MKNKIMLVFLLITISLSPILFKWWLDYRKNNFACWGKITFQKQDLKYAVQVKYIFKGNTGNLITIGEYTKLGEKPIEITQNMSFNYSRQEDQLTMVSTQSLLTETQVKLLNALVPDFYLYKDRGIRIQFHKQGSNGLVFTTASLPIFICTLQ